VNKSRKKLDKILNHLCEPVTVAATRIESQIVTHKRPKKVKDEDRRKELIYKFQRTKINEEWRRVENKNNKPVSVPFFQICV
jgi:hypothetical protein